MASGSGGNRLFGRGRHQKTGTLAVNQMVKIVDYFEKMIGNDEKKATFLLTAHIIIRSGITASMEPLQNHTSKLAMSLSRGKKGGRETRFEKSAN
jgi:hypothetical protein